MKKTVAQLIEELGQFDPTMEVRFTYNYGDYWKTVAASPIRRVDEGTVRYSEQHRMERVVEDDEECDDLKQVVLLS